MSQQPSFAETKVWLEDLCRITLNFIVITPVDEILANEDYWENLLRISIRLCEYVQQTKSFKGNPLVLKWFQWFNTIMKKDEKLRLKLINGPIRIIFYGLLYEKIVFPPWFLKSFFYFTLNFIEFDMNIMTKMYTMVCNCKDYNVQKTFIQIIYTNFDDNIHQDVFKLIENKEVLTLFKTILASDNPEINIRPFLNKLNEEEIPIKIFSFKTKQIKANGLIVFEDRWIDFNTSASTITFECTKTDLSFHENFQNSTEERREQDIITIKIDNISYISYYKINGSPEYNNGHTLILELEKPCAGFLESVSNFFEKYRVLLFHVIEQADCFNNFIYDFFTKNFQISPEILNRSNFSLNLAKRRMSIAQEQTPPSAKRVKTN